jgi:hypothetical protein
MAVTGYKLLSKLPTEPVRVRKSVVDPEALRAIRDLIPKPYQGFYDDLISANEGAKAPT